jgi:hypothetical protein
LWGAIAQSPYYPLGTVPRAYDVFRAYEGMEGRKTKTNKLKIENVIQNKIQDFKSAFFSRKKIPL